MASWVTCLWYSMGFRLELLFSTTRKGNTSDNVNELQEKVKMPVRFFICNIRLQDLHSAKLPQNEGNEATTHLCALENPLRSFSSFWGVSIPLTIASSRCHQHSCYYTLVSLTFVEVSISRASEFLSEGDIRTTWHGCTERYYKLVRILLGSTNYSSNVSPHSDSKSTL